MEKKYGFGYFPSLFYIQNFKILFLTVNDTVLSVTNGQTNGFKNICPSQFLVGGIKKRVLKVIHGSKVVLICTTHSHCWPCWPSIYIYSTVDSRYLDPSYLDPITSVELISKSRLFSLCIYCISASRMSNYFYVNTSAIPSIIFSPWIYFSLPRISNSDHDEGKKNVRCGAAGLSVNENHNRPLINKSIF